MTPLEDILKFDPAEPSLTRAQERQLNFFRAWRHLLFLCRPGVETFTAVGDQTLDCAASNSTIRDVQYYRDRVIMLWNCVIRDARESRAV